MHAGMSHIECQAKYIVISSSFSYFNPTKKLPLRQTNEAMPSSTAAHNIYSILLLSLLLVALFPSAFHYLIVTLPFSLLFPAHSNSNTPSSTSQATPPPPPPQNMSWSQKQFSLPPRSRGSYLVTDHVVSQLPELQQYKVGLLNLFVQHTSCALSLNENWDDDVRADMSDALDRIAPEAGPKGQELYRHSAEGPDDMPVGFFLSYSLTLFPKPRSLDRKGCGWTGEGRKVRVEERL